MSCKKIDLTSILSFSKLKCWLKAFKEEFLELVVDVRNIEKSYRANSEKIDDIINKLVVLEKKQDIYISDIRESREGNVVKLTYVFTNGTEKEVTFEDKDTISTPEVSALEEKVNTLTEKAEKVEKELGTGESTNEVAGNTWQ